MNIDKSPFLNFIFSFLPGAGHMYQGMMRKGTALMLAFFGIIAAGSLLYIDPIYFLLPVVWCYSFFDSMNTIRLLHAQRLQLDYQFGKSLRAWFHRDIRDLPRHVPTAVAWVCIGLGLYLCLTNFVMPVLRKVWDFMPWFESLLRKLPTLMVCLAVVSFGFYLVSGRKRFWKDVQREDDFVEYQGDDRDAPRE